MFWVAWKGYNGGKALSLGAIEQAEAEAFGMHGYPSAAAAEAHPNSVNAVDKIQVNAWIVAANDITGNPVADAKHAASAAANATGMSSMLGVVRNAFSVLDSKGTYLRAAKIIVGSIMIIVGLAKLTGTDSAVKAAAKGAVP
jgi:hypothetical protein